MKSLFERIIEELLESDVPTPEDVSNYSVKDIVLAITSQVNKCKDAGSTTFSHFYAGICKNVEDNMKRHGNKEYVALIDCGTRAKAGDVETQLSELGFDTGARPDNGGDEETIIVYVIKKDRNFKR